MPCFKGLFGDKHEDSIQDVLFSMASFHAFSKLRMHSDDSLGVYHGLTIVFGQVMRHFTSTVCNELDALPLAKEAAATASGQAKTQARSQTRAQSHARSLSQDWKRSKSPQSKTFNMFTFKWHTLGHYPSIIRHYGTLDLLGTHIVHVTIF